MRESRSGLGFRRLMLVAGSSTDHGFGPGFHSLPLTLVFHYALGNLQQAMVSSQELFIPFNTSPKQSHLRI